MLNMDRNCGLHPLRGTRVDMGPLPRVWALKELPIPWEGMRTSPSTDTAGLRETSSG